MSAKDNGGPAFPTTLNKDEEGMTLRDYFAAKAMAALICHRSADSYTQDDLAQVAYELADKMLKARQA